TDERRLALTFPTLLPRDPYKLTDRGAQVTVVVPDDLELIAPRPGPLWEAGKPDKHNKRTWTFDRWPERFEVAWQPHRPELTINAEARVTLNGRTASVSHRFWLSPGQAPVDQVPLNVPAEVIGLAVTPGGEGGPRLDGKEGGPRTVVLPAPAAPDREH